MQPLRVNKSANDGIQQREIMRECGVGRGRGSWSQESSSKPPGHLRRPYNHTLEPHIAGVSSSNNSGGFVQSSPLVEVMKKSILSADAPEFVPKTKVYQAPTSKSSLQNRLDVARNLSGQTGQQQHTSQSLNYDYQPFQGQHHDPSFDNYHQYQTYENDTKKTEYDEVSELAKTKSQLENMMHSVTLDPGWFPFLVPPIVPSIMSHLEYPNNFKSILSDIIQKSINDSNFRYSGARLCKSFDVAATPVQVKTYREILCDLCQDKIQTETYIWQKNIEHKEEQQRTCHGLIMFLAELVVQMEDPSLPLGEQLIQLINIILKKPALNTAKYVCQALKLAGHTLETNNTGCRAEMESMMRSLTELVTQGHVDSHVGRMVYSVQELRNGNWGQTAATYGSPQTDIASSTKTESDEPVFYGPDGNVLSLEEKQFLNDVTQDGNNFDELYKDDEITDEEEEEMIANAYEEFLKTLPNKKK